MSSPRSTSGVHSKIVVSWFLKSCMTLIASLPSGRSTASLCFPHRDLRSGFAAAMAASAEGTNTIVRGGGASSPAVLTSLRICLASATSLRILGTTSRRCETDDGTLPGFPMDTTSGLVFIKAFCLHVEMTSCGTFTPHRTT